MRKYQTTIDFSREYQQRYKKSLSRITGVNLAGITPLHESIITPGDGKDYEDKSKDIPLDLKDEGELSQDFDEQYRGNLFIQQNKMVEENRANLDYLYDQDIKGVMVQEAK